MNHTANLKSIEPHVELAHALSSLPEDVYPKGVPYILGETNSLASQGKPCRQVSSTSPIKPHLKSDRLSIAVYAGLPGTSNTFGGALWSVDWALLSAANNISRVHFHQGLNYRYQVS